jgi:hypothetical protein
MAHLATEKGTTAFLASILFAAAVALVALPALAQGRPPYGANCANGRKFAAGACVATCPGGYEDQGRVCVKRSEGGGGR